MKNAPIWLVPSVIKEAESADVIQECFESEKIYCIRKISISLVGISLILLSAIYLDVTYDPPADLFYSIRGRGGLGISGLAYSFWLRQRHVTKQPDFLKYKLIFALFIFSCVTYQLKYSFDYANRARYVPAVFFVLGIYALRVGPTFSAIFFSIYTAIIFIFSYFQPENLTRDLNLIALVAISVFFLQSRIQHEARYFVGQWRARQILSNSANEAKISASAAYRELIKLVYPHVVEMVQAGKQIEETMPVGHSKAVSLCFDIAGSSSIVHEKYNAALQSFLAKLYKLMFLNYNGETLVANGYRIKDLGESYCQV